MTANSAVVVGPKMIESRKFQPKQCLGYFYNLAENLYNLEIACLCANNCNTPPLISF